MTVTTEHENTIGYITLDDPDRRNPLSEKTMRTMTEALERLSGTDGVQVVVIRANGKVFSAGHDLGEMVERSLEDEQRIFDVCTRLMQTIQRIPQPVIAQVQGPAVAAGCQLVATCDLAVAAESAVFGTPGVKIGLFCSTPGVAVSRAVGRKRALQMLLTGDVIDAATAADWGLVNFAVPPEEVATRTRELAVKVADASPLTLQIGKHAFYRQVDLPQDAAYEQMSETMATNAVTCDAQEGMQAFLDKRQPVWRGE